MRGSVLYLDYGEAGEPWHERVLLQHVGREDWVVLTPDLDVYVESCAAPYVRDVRLSPALWTLPADLGEDKGRPVYRFDEADRFTPAGQKDFLTVRAEGAYNMAHRERTKERFRDCGPLVMPPARAGGRPSRSR